MKRKPDELPVVSALRHRSLDGTHTPGAKPLVFGHRGFAAEEVENTMSAFERAAAAGIAGVELDVQLSRDGVVVVTHDGDLSRLAADDRRIVTLTEAELAGVDLQTVRDGKTLTATGIPSLNTVIDTVPPPMIIDIELKSYPDTPYNLPAAVAELIVDRGIASRVLVSSFDPRLIQRFRRAVARIGTSVPTAAIYSAHRDVPRVLRRGLGAPLSGSEIAKPDWMSVLEHGTHGRRPILVWTVNAADVFAKLQTRDIAGVIGDNPGDLLRWSTEDAARSV